MMVHSMYYSAGCIFWMWCRDDVIVGSSPQKWVSCRSHHGAASVMCFDFFLPKRDDARR